MGSTSSLIQEGKDSSYFPKRRYQEAAASWEGTDDNGAACYGNEQGETGGGLRSNWTVEVKFRAGQPQISLLVLSRGPYSPSSPSLVAFTQRCNFAWALWS